MAPQRKYNCIIVDDDAFAATLLKSFCERCSELRLLAKFTNGAEAYRYLEDCGFGVDIIFLDIEMPIMNGIDFMRTAKRCGAQVVVCSSKSQYAVESYEYDVCDYLLKPIAHDRFMKAVEKAILEKDKVSKWLLVKSGILSDTNPDAEADEKSDEQTAANNENELSSDMYGGIWMRDTTGNKIRLTASEIIYAEAMENYMALLTTDRRITIHLTMKKFIEIFGRNDEVIRIHRSYIVGKKFIKSISDNTLTLLYGSTQKVDLPIGKTYLKMVNTLAL